MQVLTFRAAYNLLPTNVFSIESIFGNVDSQTLLDVASIYANPALIRADYFKSTYILHNGYECGLRVIHSSYISQVDREHIYQRAEELKQHTKDINAVGLVSIRDGDYALLTYSKDVSRIMAQASFSLLHQVKSLGLKTFTHVKCPKCKCISPTPDNAEVGALHSCARCNTVSTIQYNNVCI